jgi:hypothetical protein
MVLFSDPFFIVFAVILVVVNLCFVFLLKLIIDTKIRKKKGTSALLMDAITSETEVKRTEAKPKREAPEPTEKVEVASLTQTEAVESEAKPKREAPKQGGRWGLLKRGSKPAKSVAGRKPSDGEVGFCPKYRGYLHTLPKGSVYPDECLRCRRIISCMGVQRGQVIEEFYADEAVAE